MRQTSSFSLHRIATAIVDSPPTFTATAAAMSTTPRPPFRGGRTRGRRTFSGRPHTESHFQPVRDSNSGLQNKADFSAVNNFNNSHNNGYNYSQNYNNYPSNSASHRGRSYRGRTPPFNRRINQPPGGRVQRPKPADYRTWEVAKNPPPPHFGIRLILIGFEVDKFNDLEEDLRVRGYSGIWKMRTGDPIDGCAIFWRTTSILLLTLLMFRLTYEESVEFNKHGMRDNVAQICVLESLIPNKNEDQMASSTSPEALKRVVICNIHVLYNPRRGEIKLGQVRILLERAQAISKTWDDAPVVLCGDFNCTPMSPLYNFISEQKLDISEVDRDKISGQASAVIQPPARPSGFQPREQPTSNIDSRTAFQNTIADSTQKNSLDTNNHQTPASLQQTPVDSLLNVPLNSFEKNRGKMQSTNNLSDNQDGHTDMSKVEIDLAKPADPPINETLKGAELTSVSSTENVISSALPESQQEIKEVSISVDSSWIGNSEKLSSVTDHSDQNIRENETTCEASDPNTISELTHDVNERIIGLSLNKIDESVKGDEDFGEDVEESLCDLNIEGDAFPPNLGDLVPEDGTVDVYKPSYDPSLWTPMEIATATGAANNTILEHPLKLNSTYSEVMGSSGTRDSNGEPLVTSYNTCFMGTVDYIWRSVTLRRSEGLCTSKVLAPIPMDAMKHSGGFPTKVIDHSGPAYLNFNSSGAESYSVQGISTPVPLYCAKPKWGSDHVALASELAFSEK
ncbi:Carbon catabolite repressor protein 4-like protein 6 [Bienertia sinuspersici]